MTGTAGGADERAFLRAVHEQVLNPLHLLMQSPGSVASLLSGRSWPVDLLGIAPEAPPGDLAGIIDRAIARADAGGPQVDCPGGIEVGEARGAALGDAIVEGLRNAHRHAGATHVRVTGAVTPEGLQVTIADDGRGMSAGSLRRFGLDRVVEDAMDSIGGSATIVSAPGAGTTMTLRLPGGSLGLAGMRAADPERRSAARHPREQWPSVATGASRLFEQLNDGSLRPGDPLVARRARIEDGRIRTWLEVLRLRSWLAGEVFQRVTAAAAADEFVRVHIHGEGGLPEPLPFGLAGLLEPALSVNLTVGPESEDLIVLGEGLLPPLPPSSAHADIASSVAAGGQFTVRITRRA